MFSSLVRGVQWPSLHLIPQRMISPSSSRKLSSWKAASMPTLWRIMAATYGKAAAAVFWPLPKRRSVTWKLWTRIFSHRANKLWICMEFCGGGSLQDVYHGKNPSSKSLHQSLSTRSLCVMYCRYIQGRQILIITRSHDKPEKPVFIHVFIIAHPLHHTHIHTYMHTSFWGWI